MSSASWVGVERLLEIPSRERKKEMCPYMSQSTRAAAVQMGGFTDYAWNWPPSLSGQHELSPDASSLTREPTTHVASKQLYNPVVVGLSTKRKVYLYQHI